MVQRPLFTGISEQPVTFVPASCIEPLGDALHLLQLIRRWRISKGWRDTDEERGSLSQPALFFAVKCQFPLRISCQPPGGGLGQRHLKIKGVSANRVGPQCGQSGLYPNKKKRRSAA